MKQVCRWVAHPSFLKGGIPRRLPLGLSESEVELNGKSCRAVLGLDGSETRPYMVRVRFHLLFQLPTFVPVDVAERFVLMCNYTGKEVV